jgi:hypothetical protein
MPNRSRLSKGGGIQKNILMVKEELDKLLEARFIKPMETTKWVFLVLLTLKENSKLRVCVNHKVLNKVTKKD